MKDEKLCYFWEEVLERRFYEKRIYIGKDCLKGEGSDSLREGGPWQERGEVVVLKGREGDTPMHTMNLVSYFTSKISKVRLI